VNRAIGVALVALLAAALGCGKSKSSERIEAERIIAAIERLGTVPASDREPLLDALEADRAASPRVETLRTECAAAYRALHTAQVGLAQTAKGDPFAAPESLKLAHAAIEQAKAAHERCVKALAEVRTTIGSP
jgi:hypothetical protein